VHCFDHMGVPMSANLSRRSALGLGAAAAAAVTVGAGSPAQAAPAGPACIPSVYAAEKAKAGGAWHSHIAAVDGAGGLTTLVEDDADKVVPGYSVQKVAVAAAVMDKIDRGQLTLATKLDLQADIILKGSGIYHLHGVWGDNITVANFLTAMLVISDNTSVRMCGRVVPALEINQILADKGFAKTRVGLVETRTGSCSASRPRGRRTPCCGGSPRRPCCRRRPATSCSASCVGRTATTTAYAG
jgi:beta-lactamase class A